MQADKENTAGRVQTDNFANLFRLRKKQHLPLIVEVIQILVLTSRWSLCETNKRKRCIIMAQSSVLGRCWLATGLEEDMGKELEGSGQGGSSRGGRAGSVQATH